MNNPIDDQKLEIEIQNQFKVLRDIPVRDADAVIAGREKFLSQAAEIRANLPVSKSEGSRHSNQSRNLSTLFGLRKEPLPMLAQIGLAILLAFTLLAGGGGATVYASQSSQPDDLLYPVKTWSEDIRYQLTNSEMEQLQLSLEFTERRLEELQLMQQNQTPAEDALIERLQLHIQNSLQLMTQLQLSEQDQLQIRDRLRTQDQLMEQLQLMQGIPEDGLLLQAREMIQLQLRLAGVEIEDPVQTQQQTQQQQQTGQSEDSPQNQQEGQGPLNGTGTGNGPEYQNGPDEPAGVCQENQTDCEPVQNQEQNQEQSQEQNQEQDQTQQQNQQQEPGGEPAQSSPEPEPKGGK